MKKIILALAAILILSTSCDIFSSADSEADYVGKWIQTIASIPTAESYYELTITSDSYTVSEVTKVLSSGYIDSFEMEKGTVSERDFAELIFTKTHERDASTNELLQILTQNQVSRTIVWTRTGNTLTLVDGTNVHTNGDFSKD